MKGADTLIYATEEQLNDSDLAHDSTLALLAVEVSPIAKPLPRPQPRPQRLDEMYSLD